MRLYPIPFALLMVAMFACSDDSDSPRDAAMQRATAACNASFEQMAWLDSLLVKTGSTDSMSAYGSVYMIPTSQGTMFVHQPLVMSCMGCFVYTCSGERLEASYAMVVDEILPGMGDKKNLLYEPPPL